MRESVVEAGEGAEGTETVEAAPMVVDAWVLTEGMLRT
jgi:hypothetical protein